MLYVSKRGIHCHDMVPWNLDKIASGNGLVPDGIKVLSEAMLGSQK